MKNKEIIEKAIKKIDFNNSKDYIKTKQYNVVFIGVEDNGDLVFENTITKDISTHTYETLIYSNWFLKEFFGEKMIEVRGHEKNEYTWVVDERKPAWEHYAQQMVIKEEPLKYLEQFLTKEE
jgi:hypothetical protein